MSSRILFISDLHLEESRPDITRALLDFLDANRQDCQALYVLGDLFEVWIGDDDDSELAESIASAFKAFTSSGASLYFMHGNRDFLIGSAYADRCGAILIEEPFLLDSEAGTVLLMHGDLLCVDDTDYMQFRKMVRQADWQSEFLDRSLQERREFARQARQQSQAATASKQAEIMDVNQAEVLRTLQQSSQTILLHGHTHRPAVHKFPLESPIDGQHQATRLVLGDWDKQGWYAEITQGKLQLHALAAPA